MALIVQKRIIVGALKVLIAGPSLCYHQVGVPGHKPVFDCQMKLSILASVGLFCNLILM